VLENVTRRIFIKTTDIEANLEKDKYEEKEDF